MQVGDLVEGIHTGEIFVAKEPKTCYIPLYGGFCVNCFFTRLT